MKAIQLISQDLFDKVRSRFTNLEMGDETGAVTIDPAEARFFDFDFVNEGVNLGRVSISLNDLGSLKIYYSQGITENQDDPSKQVWYGFLKEMRMFAMRRLLRFDTRDIAKTNLDRNDFQHLAATQAPKEEDPTMNMTESRWNQKSSKKTSRAVKGATEVIVRHHKAVDEMYAGSRSQRNNIRAIYIQNKDGERFKYPFIHPAGAFAMAQHVDHGGVPHDPAGKAIVRMSEQIAQLQEFQRQVQHTSLHDDAMGITERAVGRLNELKATIEALSKRHHYESWVGELAGVDQGDDLMELDPVTMETYKAKFTETNFKEDLASFFPLIHRIMQETNTIDLEEYVSEESDICPDCKEDPCVCGTSVKENAFSKFEEWAEATEQGQLTDDEIEALKQAMNELPNGELELGPDGQTAWQFFSGLGLTDSDLEDKFKSASDLDPSADPMEVLKMWAQESYPELLVALGLTGSGQEQQPPAEMPPAAPAPAAPPAQPPVAEGKEGNMVQEVAKIVKSFYNRDNPEVGPFRGGEGIALDVKKQIAEKFGEEAGEQAAQMAEQFMNKLTMEWQQRHGTPVNGDDGLARLKELLGNVKQKVESISPDKEDPPFDPDPPRDGERKDQFGNPIKHVAKHLAKQGMKQVQGDDGLARLKELVGSIKAKVEGTDSHQASTTMKHVDASNASDTEKSAIRQASKDIKPGVKGYGDRADALKAAGVPDDRGPNEGGPDKSQVPAFKRKEQGGDWKMSTKDLEKEKTNSPTSSAGLARKKAELGMSEGPGDLATALSKLSGSWSGWHKEEDMSTPEVDHYEYDDGEGGYYGRGTIEHNLKTGEVKVEYHDSENDMDVDGTFKNMGDAMRALRGDLGVNHGGKAPNFDRLGHRKQHGPDDLRKTDRTGRKGSLAGGPTNSLKRDIEFNKGKHGPSGPLPEMADILRLAGLAK
jgi:hypothetical protein